jgi:hypothetical protein
MGAKVPATFLNCQKKCKRRTKKLRAPCAPQVWRQPIRLRDFGPWIKYSDAAKQAMFKKRKVKKSVWVKKWLLRRSSIGTTPLLHELRDESDLTQQIGGFIYKIRAA